MALHRRAKGRCELCGCHIGSSFHADHQIPYAYGGPTEVWNGQALCPKCNLSKSMNIDLSPVIPYGTEPREWQHEFVTSLQKGCIKFFLDQSQKEKVERLPYVLNAFPGTGKTYGSMLAAAYMLHTGMVEHVIYCVPWDNLRAGAAHTARQLFGLELVETRHPSNLLDLNDGYNKGAVVTYGQLNGKCGGPLASLCRDYRVLVIADEMHHLEENSGWGGAFQSVFKDAHLMLMTTGTPIRSDGSAMPYARYVKDGRMQRIVTNYDFGYDEALKADGGPDVLQINFEPWDGEVTWRVDNPDGTTTEYAHGISEDLKATYQDRLPKQEIEQLEGDRLRHCMDMPDEGHSSYIARAFADADNWLLGTRKREDRNATGLIVCSKCDHANSMADYIEKQTGQRPAVIHGGSDGESIATKDARKWLSRYQSKHPNSDLPRWIVSVGMLKEGVDVPQLAALLYATNITAPLSWIQIVGRILRVPLTKNKQMLSQAWMPRTPEFNALMQGMKDAVQDYKAKKAKDGGDGPTPGDGGNNGRLKRETEGLGNEAEHDGSIHHATDGTFVHNEEEIGIFRDLLPAGTSAAAALAAGSLYGDTKEERIKTFIKLQEMANAD